MKACTEEERARARSRLISMAKGRRGERALAAVPLLFAACAGAAPNGEPPAGSPDARPLVARADDAPELEPWLAASCAPKGKRVLRAEDARRDGSAVALARTEAGRLLALVADHDRHRLDVVDVETASVMSSAEVMGAPEQVLVLEGGRVLVTVGDKRHVEVFDFADAVAPSFTRLCAREVAAGPFGAARSEDGASLVVSSAWQPALTRLDPETLATRAVIPLPRAPRGVVIDGRWAFVSHLSGARVSRVDLAAEKPVAAAVDLSLVAASMGLAQADVGLRRGGSQGYALASVSVRSGADASAEAPSAVRGAAPPKPAAAARSSRILAPMVSVDPGSSDRVTSHYYGPPPTQGVPKQAAVTVAIDPAAGRALTRHVIAATPDSPAGQCLLPRAVAFDAEREHLFVVCLGLDQMLELDARVADPMRAIRARFDVPKGPLGVAVSQREGVAVVLGQFDSTLAIVPLDKAPQRRVSLGPSPLDEVTAAGRELFYRSDDPLITEEGMACASCHPDGGDDGLTWFTPEGARQTPMLAGRLGGTEPFGWTRGQHTLTSYIADTCNRLGGKGLPDPELAALASYVRNLPSPPRERVRPVAASAAEGDASPSAAVELALEGRSAFFERGCGECHVGAVGTNANAYGFDGSFAMFDTPSLRHVGQTAPYFHDGRYPTLEALLADRASGMGETAKLSPREVDAIAAFLRTL